MQKKILKFSGAAQLCLSSLFHFSFSFCPGLYVDESQKYVKIFKVLLIKYT